MATAQSINQDNRDLSDLFRDLCKKDAYLLEKIIEEEKLGEWSLSCRLFSHNKVCDKPLKSIGFVVALIAIVAKSKYAVDYLNFPSEKDVPNLVDLKEFRYRETSFREAILHISQFEKHVPCIFLDEFNLDRHKALLVYMRNILRALGVVCVTVGTDPRASGLIATSFLPDSASTDGKGDVWVYAWNRLPKMTFDKLTRSTELRKHKRTFQNRPEWVKFFAWFETIPSQNCRMMTFAAEQVLKYFFLDDCLKKPFHEFLFYLIYNVQLELSKIKGSKNGNSKLYARIGSIVSNFMNWREDFREAKNKVITSDLIHSHYALLDFPLYTSDINDFYFALERDYSEEGMILTAKGSSDKWEPCSTYPEVKNNELYYLIIEAAQARNGMQYFSNRTSISVFWQYFQKIYRHNSSHSNPHNAFRRPGPDFESRMGEGSLAGTDFDFDENSQINIQSNPHLSKISGRIPYLAPMNSTFSEAFIALEGIFVRFLESTKDSEQIDGRISRRSADEMHFVVEFKHWSGAVLKSQIASIVLKAYNNEFKKNGDLEVSNVVLIITRKISDIDRNTQFEELEELRKHRDIVFLEPAASSTSRGTRGTKNIHVRQRVLKSSSTKTESTIYVILFSLTAIFGEDYATSLYENLNKYVLNDSGSLVKNRPEQDQSRSVPSTIPVKRRAYRNSVASTSHGASTSKNSQRFDADDHLSEGEDSHQVL